MEMRQRRSDARFKILRGVDFCTGILSTPNVLSLSRHVPSRARGATHRVAPDEPRKRRADERHVVGCCEELGVMSQDVVP